MEEESLLADADVSTPNLESTETTDAPTVTEGFDHVLDKYKAEGRSIEESNTEQAKAYKDLQSKFGGFTGSPEGDYELSFPDGVEGEWNEGDALMEGFQTWAKDNNLSQDKFTDLLHIYVANEQKMLGTDRESELSAIGDNAESRLQSISDYARANLSEENYQGILAATTTAAGVKAIEALIAQTRGLKVPTGAEETTSSGMSREEIRAQMADPRYQSDPSFRAKVAADYERLLGSGPANKTFG